jgi:hypothetical protein
MYNMAAALRHSPDVHPRVWYEGLMQASFERSDMGGMLFPGPMDVFPDTFIPAESYSTGLARSLDRGRSHKKQVRIHVIISIFNVSIALSHIALCSLEATGIKELLTLLADCLLPFRIQCEQSVCMGYINHTFSEYGARLVKYSLASSRVLQLHTHTVFGVLSLLCSLS